MPRPPSTLADAFVSHLGSLERTRRRFEHLLSKSLVSRRDVEHIYESIFITAVASFETMLEDLFFGLLTGRFKAGRGVHPRVTFRSERVAREVVFGERGGKYLDWLPYKITEDRAERFFRGGRPFKRPPNAVISGELALRAVTEADYNLLVKTLNTRNAIAHQSAFAKRKFEETVIGTTPLLPREKTPAGFLRSPVRDAPQQTRCEQFSLELATIAHKLCG